MSKAKSNYQLLEENRKKALEIASRVSEKKTPIAKEINLEGEKLHSVADLTRVIKKLDEAKDSKLGIIWIEDPSSKTRVRDARKIDPDDPIFKEDLGEKYAMQVLNEVRAGILLLENQPKTKVQEEAIAKLLLIADKSLTEIDSLPKNILAYNHAMVKVLTEAGIPNAADQLNFAKEIASFKDEHYHIVTLNKVTESSKSPIVGLPKPDKYHTSIEADIMLNGLTELQRKQYQAIAASKKGSTVTVAGANMDWYNKLPEYQRNLIRNVAGDIALGEKVIPAQLRELIGVRNGYEKTTAIISPPDNQLEVLTQSLHCGAPASKNKHGAEAITKENITQLKSYIEPDSALNLENLTSKTTAIPFLAKYGIRSENWIAKQLEKVVSGLVTTTMSPINRWRILGGGRKQDTYEQNLKTIAEKLAADPDLKEKTAALQEFLSNPSSTTEATDKAYNEIYNNLKENPKLQRTLIAAATAREYLSMNNQLGDTHNNNAETVAQMQIVQYGVKTKGHPLHELFGEEDAKKYSINVIFCKSGKDRTGLTMLKASFAAIASRLGLNTESQENALKTLGAGNHTQEMAGIQGGSVGNHSIKMSAEFGLNPGDKALEGVVNQKSSGYNSEIKFGGYLFHPIPILQNIPIPSIKNMRAQWYASSITKEVSAESALKSKTTSSNITKHAKVEPTKLNTSIENARRPKFDDQKFKGNKFMHKLPTIMEEVDGKTPISSSVIGTSKKRSRTSQTHIK